jgi:hypothetical protein
MPVFFILMLALTPNLAPISSQRGTNVPVALSQLEDYLYAARPNPYNIGNCYQYKNCLGESIGNMWISNPEFCKPLGGKSWMDRTGRCINFPDGPQPLDPQDFAANED